MFRQRILMQIFPHADISNVRIGYLITVAESASFVTGNWIFFWTLFMSFSQIGFVDSLAFAFGIGMEIPTGVVADLVGKRWTVCAALFLNGAAFLVMGSAQHLGGLILGFLLFQCGLALYSGAAEALQYDTLILNDRAAGWEQVVSASSSLSFAALILASLIGAPMYSVNARLPHLACGMAFLGAFLAALRLSEPQTRQQQRISLRAYFKQLVVGVNQLGSSKLRMFVPLLLGLPGIYVIFSSGIVQPAVAVRFGFDANAQAVIASGAYLLMIVGVRYAPKLRHRFGDFGGLTLINSCLVIALIGMALPLGTSGAAMMLLMSVIGAISRTWTSVIINERISSEYRATTLSTVALFTKLPYVLIAACAGLMIDHGQLGILLLLLASGSGLLWIAAYRLREKPFSDFSARADRA